MPGHGSAPPPDRAHDPARTVHIDRGGPGAESQEAMRQRAIRAHPLSAPGEDRFARMRESIESGVENEDSAWMRDMLHKHGHGGV